MSTKIARTLILLEEIDKDSKIYKCIECKKQLSGKQISNLTSHFKIAHKEIYNNKIKSKPETSIFVQREKMLHSCVEMVTINSLPFRVLSQSGFKSAIEDKLDAFKEAGVPLNLFNENVLEIKEKVRQTAAKIREKIKTETRNKMISVMVDSATRNGRSIFGISIQYKYNGVLQVVTIAMRELHESHTAQNLAKVLLEVLYEYGIKLNQTLSITTDNGSNMLAMVKEAERQLKEERKNDINEQSNKTTDASTESDEHANTDDENVDSDIEKVLNEQEIDDDDVLGSMLDDDTEIYEELLNKLVDDLRGRSGNDNVFVNSIKCAAHTIQLAVHDALKLLPKRD